MAPSVSSIEKRVQRYAYFFIFQIIRRFFSIFTDKFATFVSSAATKAARKHTSQMKRIGIISDTHGTFDARLRHFLADVDEIWHAGDIGSLELADEIAAFKPLRAVWGNIDGGMMRRVYRQTEFFRVEQVPVLMTHIGGYPRHYAPGIAQLIQELRPRIFVAGHSHILRVMADPVYDLLHINPGAAGIYGFHKVRTAVRFTVDGADIRDMEVGEWPRE